jgi:hypothetical protein
VPFGVYELSQEDLGQGSVFLIVKVHSEGDSHLGGCSADPVAFISSVGDLTTVLRVPVLGLQTLEGSPDRGSDEIFLELGELLRNLFAYLVSLLSDLVVLGLDSGLLLL